MCSISFWLCNSKTKIVSFVTVQVLTFSVSVTGILTLICMCLVVFADCGITDHEIAFLAKGIQVR